MKKILVFTGTLLSLMAGFGNIVAAQIIVSGAFGDVNGTFNNTFSYMGKAAYERTTGSVVILWRSDFAEWRFTNGGGNGRYYYNTSNTTLPPSSGWQEGDWSGSAPTLSGMVYYFTVSNAGSSVVNGEYNYDGSDYYGKKIYRQNGGAGCGIYWTSTQWMLSSSAGEPQYYYNTADTPTPPTGGWQIGTGGEANAPTLAGDVDPFTVELTSFTATAKGTIIELKWNTAAEVNNYGFDIEKSSIQNRTVWTKIGFVEGNGTTNAPKSYRYADAHASGTERYRLKQIDHDGQFEYSNVVEASVAGIKAFGLDQNYPNPFNPATVISYQIPVKSFVSLNVYDALGRTVAILVDEVQEAGTYSAAFNGSTLSSGMYFYTLQSGSFTATKKLSLMK